jgi:uncharacterized protein YcaQ
LKDYTLTKRQARKFILIKQGLLGEYKFHGKEGILDFVSQAGCIQYDPIDVCGKNAELVLQSRVEGFTKEMLSELLYKDRKLIDYFDKNLSIMLLDDWKYFGRIREGNKRGGRGFEEVNKVADFIIELLHKNGAMCSKDIDMNDKVDWYWSNTRLARAALETLYFRGDLIVHHKVRTVKYYAPTKDYLPNEIINAKDPYETEIEHMKWRVKRRIGAVGLLWNKPSDAWLNIWNLKSNERNIIFKELLEEDQIIKVNVEDSAFDYYCLRADINILHSVLEWMTYTGVDKELENKNTENRTELIAPLDNMLWDRKLIKELFGFSYKWEIYTPVTERKYGYYVLPILSGEQFIGRTEVICDNKNKTLTIKKVWYEENVKINSVVKKEIKKCFLKFMKFHGLKEVIYLEKL